MTGETQEKRRCEHVEMRKSSLFHARVPGACMYLLTIFFWMLLVSKSRLEIWTEEEGGREDKKGGGHSKFQLGREDRDRHSTDP